MSAVNGYGVTAGAQDAKRVKLSSTFGRVETVPLAEAFLMKDLFLANENPQKINLSVGGESASDILYHHEICVGRSGGN